MIYSLIHLANSEQKKIISAALIGFWAYLKTTCVLEQGWNRVGTQPGVANVGPGESHS